MWAQVSRVSELVSYTLGREGEGVECGDWHGLLAQKKRRDGSGCMGV